MLVLWLAAGCGGDGDLHPRLDGPPVLVGAGDIAICGEDGDEATAALLDTILGTVFTTGDNAYNAGTKEEFRDCYAPTWGRHKERTRPTAGNHDYYSPGATGYFAYFGDAAGSPDRGYYSYDVGAWHVLALNSNVDASATSAQAEWLRADLEAHRTTCTVAYWHNPRFSSSGHGSDARFEALWQVLYDAGVDVVLAGHDHIYERFAPQTPSGVPDTARGIRQFTVGTGGGTPYPVKRIERNSEVRVDNTLGVLKLELEAARYRWQFIGVDGGVKDSGTADCH
jgi:hypothetical protein